MGKSASQSVGRALCLVEADDDDDDDGGVNGDKQWQNTIKLEWPQCAVYDEFHHLHRLYQQIHYDTQLYHHLFGHNFVTLSLENQIE